MHIDTTMPREILEAQFPESLVKQRPGAFGSSLSYIEGHTIIGRLNEAFGACWSFEIASHEVLDEEVLVCGKFRCESANVVKMAFGSSKITRDSRTGIAIALGDDLKSASTDALKKAATLLGVGLYLYSSGNGTSEPIRDDRSFEEDLKDPAPGNGQGNGRNRQAPANPNPNGDSRVTNKQINAIFAIGRQKGMNNEEIRSMSRELFLRNVDYLAKYEASQLIESLLDR